jgi:hypothetical protein
MQQTIGSNRGGKCRTKLRTISSAPPTMNA